MGVSSSLYCISNVLHDPKRAGRKRAHEIGAAKQDEKLFLVAVGFSVSVNAQSAKCEKFQNFCGYFKN